MQPFVSESIIERRERVEAFICKQIALASSEKMTAVAAMLANQLIDERVSVELLKEEVAAWKVLVQAAQNREKNAKSPLGVLLEETNRW